MVSLTRRQEEFIRNLLDLSRESHGPVHYTELAERLGVSRFTAYDMLRLLEEKGLVASHYRLDEGRSGPGRSEVVYTPTEQAREILARALDGVAGQNWEEMRENLLQRIQQGETGHLDLAREVLARVPPEEPEAVRYCAEVMTVVALRLRRHKGRKLLLAYLPHLLPESDAACRAGLSLLGGFALGVLADETGENGAWADELLEHVQRYQSLVIEMEADMCLRLARRLRQIFRPLADG